MSMNEKFGTGHKNPSLTVMGKLRVASWSMPLHQNLTNY